ncbi:MAG: trigger factor [Firmicutes bacterium]|nr:trigger factor [Bacillota bacterium]
MAKKAENKKVENKQEVVIKIEGQDWTEAVDKAFEEKRKDVTVSGFRKGKVPRNIYEKNFGKESLYMAAIDNVVNVAYVKALEESKLVPVVQPKVDIKSITDEGVEFVFTIVTKPSVNIKKYKGLKVKKETVKVTKEEIEHEMKHILERYGEVRVKEEGTLENGNIAVIDFEGFKDGVAFDGGKGENYDLEIGSNTFIPGFEEQLVGMKKEEEREINVTFPEEYPAENLKGAAVVFKVKLHEIKEKVEREFDEELFEDLAMEGVNSKEDLEKELKLNIEAQKEMDAENRYVDTLLEEVAKNVEVDIPEEMVEEEVERLLGRYEQQLKMQGVSLDLYYQITRTTEADLKQQLEKEGYKNVLYRLMLEEIANLEKIEISEEDANKQAEELAGKYNMAKDEFLKAFGGIEMIQYDMEIRKVVDFLKEENK